MSEANHQSPSPAPVQGRREEARFLSFSQWQPVLAIKSKQARKNTTHYEYPGK